MTKLNDVNKTASVTTGGTSGDLFGKTVDLVREYLGKFKSAPKYLLLRVLGPGGKVDVLGELADSNELFRTAEARGKVQKIFVGGMEALNKLIKK